MVVYTMTKKQILRIIMTVLIAAAVILLLIFAVFGSVTASADTGKKPVRSVERGDNKIALTFNCAWDAGDIDAILSALSDGAAAATFFVTGEFCDAHPDAVKRMAAAGHSVQSLTDKNIHIKGININDLIADAKSAAKKIKTITGKDPILYRAPFDDFDDKALTTLEGIGLIPVQWSVDSNDLDDPDAFSVKKRVTDSTASGSVLLFHNDCPVTAGVLAELITGLKQKGFEFVRAEELVYTGNCTTDEKGVQHYRPAVSASLPIVYSDTNPALDSAFEKMRQNLTLQQIYDLSSVGRVGMVDEIRDILSESEQYAVREASYDELTDCYLTLVYAAEHYGAGGTYAEPEYEQIPQIVAPQDETDPGTDEQEIIETESAETDTAEPDSDEDEFVK